MENFGLHYEGGPAATPWLAIRAEKTILAALLVGACTLNFLVFHFASELSSVAHAAGAVNDYLASFYKFWMRSVVVNLGTAKRFYGADLVGYMELFSLLVVLQTLVVTWVSARIVFRSELPLVTDNQKIVVTCVICTALLYIGTLESTKIGISNSYLDHSGWHAVRETAMTISCSIARVLLVANFLVSGRR